MSARNSTKNQQTQSKQKTKASKKALRRRKAKKDLKRAEAKARAERKIVYKKPAAGTSQRIIAVLPDKRIDEIMQIWLNAVTALSNPKRGYHSQ